MGDQILYRFGALPEQVSKDNGEPCWVIPLTWSHAMYVWCLQDLKRRGFIMPNKNRFMCVRNAAMKVLAGWVNVFLQSVEHLCGGDSGTKK